MDSRAENPENTRRGNLQFNEKRDLPIHLPDFGSADSIHHDGCGNREGTFASRRLRFDPGFIGPHPLALSGVFESVVKGKF